MDAVSQPASSFVPLPEIHQTEFVQKKAMPLVERAKLSVTAEEKQAHQALMQRIEQESGGHAIWKNG